MLFIKHRHPIIDLLILVSLFTIPINCLANQPSPDNKAINVLNNLSRLATEGAVDDQGRPIHIPSERATIIPSTQAIKNSRYISVNDKRGSKHRERAYKRLKRSHIADSPNCRWLDSRMTALEKQLYNKNNKHVQHYQEELAHRQREWRCLKCATSGPTQSDHASCQYRR